MEQWPNRGANQSIENSQASHVRPRRSRTVAGPYDAATVIHGARIVRQIPITGDNNIFRDGLGHGYSESAIGDDAKFVRARMPSLRKPDTFMLSFVQRRFGSRLAFFPPLLEARPPTYPLP